MRLLSQAIQLPILGILNRKNKAIARAGKRYSCKLEAKLVMIQGGASLEGRLTDFSTVGAMFRPRLAYLMDRRNEPVCLMLAGLEIFGRIVSTKPAGFGIQFDEPLTQSELAQLVTAAGQGDEVPIYK